jgi:hypothetical protein
MARIPMNPYADDEHNENRSAPPGFLTSVNTDKRADYEAEQMAEEIDPESRQFTDEEARHIAERQLWNEQDAKDESEVLKTPEMDKLSEADQAAIISARIDIQNEKEERGNQIVAAHLTSEQIAAVEQGQTVVSGNLKFQQNEQGQFTGGHKDGSKQELIDIDRVKEIVGEREQRKEAAHADPKHEAVSQTFTAEQFKAMESGDTVKRGDQTWKIEDGQLKGENSQGGKSSYNAEVIGEKIADREAEKAAKIEAKAQAEQTKAASFELSSKDVSALQKGETVTKGPMQYQRDGKEIVASLKGAPEQGTRVDGNTVKAAVEKRERAQNQLATHLDTKQIAALEKGETVKVNGIECQKRGQELQATGPNGTTHTLKMDEVKGKVAEREMAAQKTASADRSNTLATSAGTSAEGSASKKVNAEPTKVERLRDMGEGAKMTEKSGNSYSFDHKTNELVRHDKDGKETGRKPFEEVKNAELNWKAQQQEANKANEKGNDKANAKTPSENQNVDAEQKKPTTKERRKALAEETNAGKHPEHAERVNAIKSAAMEGKQKSEEKDAAKNAEPPKVENNKKKEDELAK